MNDIDGIISVLNQAITPEMIILCGALACILAVVTLMLAGRSAFVHGLESRRAELDAQIGERKLILGDVGTKLAEVEELRKRVEHGEKRFTALQQELKPLEEKYLKALSDYEDAKGKFRDTREQWDDLREKVELYQERIAQLDTLERDVKELTEKHNELSSLIKDLPERKNEYDKLKDLLDSTKKEADDLTLKIKSLQESIKEANSVLDGLRKQEDELNKAIKDKQSQLDKIEAQTKIVDLELAIKREKAGFTAQLTAESFKSLNNPVFQKVSTLADTDERMMLSGLAEYLEQSGFDFSERLQMAFHTAVKTSDISCLTVMAGVSGTGKSALPRLYAKAMGINFLPIAVEPRWDSPHDLFGFFNYMENRFESTMLGRALVQFDAFGAQPGELKDQMLMVLLDEMNLARIEYYFSEFLSRLELRRDIDLNKPEDFQKVSTEIFSGSRDNENRAEPIRLFAGSNILFVGTMNEDESTQSLSDKVIDRANVLHFGRPKTLHNTTERRDVAALPAKGAITVDAWNNWQKTPNDGVINNYSTLIQHLASLNETLGDLGRPFAHRTYKAILQYVANYPTIKNGYQRPLADQIAMRIMPKLRGLDLQDNHKAFQLLQSDIQKIGDDDLMNAFDTACKSPQGFFQWKGIDWKN